MNIRIASRSSTLAQIQVQELMKQIPHFWELNTYLSLGDKDKNISLLQNPVSDIFTREIDQALLSGKADVAVHSAKDLPYPLDPELEIIALTEAFDQSDSLVSKDNLSLGELPSGARIGTSSQERKRQILELRPDLEIVSIRGTIEERIEQVDQGFVDGLIVATCALVRLNLQHRAAEKLPFTTAPLQGKLAVLSRKNRLELRKIFSPVDSRKHFGSVSLVGFGPGDPGLLTMKGYERLTKAHVIFYDALIPEDYLSSFPCAKEYVGKRKNNHSYSQEEISEKIYQAAIRGQEVVRLKGGDPFIFGRGGEEADYLKSRLINVEIVPGITAAQGASGSLSVPLTTRGVSSSIHFSTAHAGPEHSESGTEVFYMGGTRLSDIQKKLLDKGFPPETPVLLVENATTPAQFTIKTEVENLHKAKARLPVIVIAGDVAKDYRPEKIILNCGLKEGSFGLSGPVFHHRLIEVEKVDLQVNLERYDGILFTSKTAVEYFTGDYDLSRHKIYSIGAKTSEALRSSGLEPFFTSSKPDSDVFAGELQNFKDQKLLYPSSSLSKNKIRELQHVDTVVQYETRLLTVEKVDLERVGGILFTSPSTVESFIQNYHEIPQVDIFCFGKFTRQKIEEYREDLFVQTIQI